MTSRQIRDEAALTRKLKYEFDLQAGKFEIKTKDLLTDLERIHAGGVDMGVSTGWKSLDPFYRVKKGEMCVVTGIPGHGKSSFVDSLIMSLAKHRGWKFSLFSPENEPYQIHLRKLVEIHAGCPLYTEIIDEDTGDKFATRMPGDKLSNALKFINDKFFWVNTPETTLANVTDVWAKHVNDENVDGVVLDPWNEIIPTPPDGMNETQYINMCLKFLREFAIVNNVAMWIVAHPAKMYRNKDGDFPVPSLNDISGSAAWRAKAHVGIVIHRQSVSENVVDILVQKVRFKTSGKPGHVRLNYDYDSGRFYEP